MTDAQRTYCIAQWKTKTTTQLAIELNSADHIVRPADVHNFLTKQGIQPITKRDLVTKQVIELLGNGGNTQVAHIARTLKVSHQLIKEIIGDIDIVASIKKSKAKESRRMLDEGEINKKRVERMAARDKRLKEIKASRASFTIYNQTGSPLLDELRNIKTTEREKTLLSTGKK